MNSPSKSRTGISAQGVAETSTTSLTLSKSERQKILRQIWLFPLMIMLILIVSTYFLWQESMEKLDKERQSTNTITRDLQKVRERLNKVAEEEQEIIQKSKQFQALEKRGVLSPMNDLDIQEFLYTQASTHNIGEFEYIFLEVPYTKTLETVLEKEVNETISTNYPSEADKAQYEVSLTGIGQTMDFKVQHEVQLLNFLKSITINTGSVLPPVLVRLNKCHIKRINPQRALSPVQYNFSAKCYIDWITLLRKRL